MSRYLKGETLKNGASLPKATDNKMEVSIMTYANTIVAKQWHNIKTTNLNLVSLSAPKNQLGFDYRALY